MPVVAKEGGRTVLGSNYIESFGPGVIVEAGVKSALIQGNFIDSHGRDEVIVPREVKVRVMLQGNLFSHGPSGTPPRP